MTSASVCAIADTKSEFTLSRLLDISYAGSRMTGRCTTAVYANSPHVQSQ